jgi:lysophospholipase L1-like esterase/tetratricopeptide (TPR) repeat protein
VPRPRRLLLALGALIASLLVVEAVLRVLGAGAAPDPSPFPLEAVAGVRFTLPDDELGLRLAPDAEILGAYRTNARGWRGPQVADARAPGALRLLALGDSTTFGLGVREEQRWTDVLQRLLALLLEGRRAVEVVNAGLPSYSSCQNLVQLERELPRLRPDVVVWSVTGLNDSCATLERTDAEQVAWARGTASLWDGLLLVQTLGLATRPPPGPSRLRVTAAELEANLRAAARLARRAGVPLVLLVSARTAAVVRLAPMQAEVDAIVERVAQEEGLPLADARPRFAALAPREPFPDTVHPDPDGQRLIAWTVLEALLAEGAPLGGEARAGFGRAWLVAQRDGVGAVRAEFQGVEPPPAFAALLAALDQPDVDARLAAGDPALPEALRLHDPLLGHRRPALLEARLRLQVAGLLPEGAPEAGAAAAEAARRAGTCAEFLRPRDPLLGLLGGEEAFARDTGDLARDLPPARALWVLSSSVDALVVPADRRLERATAALRAGAPQFAVQAAQDALALDPAGAAALLLAGQALEQLGRRDEAEASFARAAALAPESALGRYLLGRARLRQGQVEEAEALLRQAVGQDPLLAEARYALGTLLLDAGRLDEAELQLRVTALLRGPDHADLPTLLAGLQRRRAGG